MAGNEKSNMPLDSPIPELAPHLLVKRILKAGEIWKAQEDARTTCCMQFCPSDAYGVLDSSRQPKSIVSWMVTVACLFLSRVGKSVVLLITSFHILLAEGAPPNSHTPTRRLPKHSPTEKCSATSSSTIKYCNVHHTLVALIFLYDKHHSTGLFLKRGLIEVMDEKFPFHPSLRTILASEAAGLFY